MKREFESLSLREGSDGRLRGSFSDALASEVARTIYEDLSAQGLTLAAIRRVACALMGVSSAVNWRGNASPPRPDREK